MDQAQIIAPLQSFTEEEIAAIYAAGRSTELAAGQTLFCRGDLGDSMYLLEEGNLELLFVDGDPGKVLGPGDVFGELAFITGGHQRTATARAATPCRLRILDESAVETLFEHQPRLLIRLLRRTCGYLLDSEERLIGSLRQRNHELEQTLAYLRRTREEVDYQELLANTDQLTGLFNRRCFDRQLARSIRRAETTGTGLALLLVDLDNFKEVNDTLGHATGDEVLRRVAKTLESCVRSSDLPCRFGGDELAIILPDIDAPTAEQRAQRIRRQIEEMSATACEPTTRVTASIGGTMLRPNESAAELFERADRQLYVAKGGGRNRVAWQA